VQVEPMKPVLKVPGTGCLKRKCYGLLSSFAFHFNLRRYTTEPHALIGDATAGHHVLVVDPGPMVGRCRLTVSKPVVKAPVISALEATM
jgi:hypothetical protein